MAPTPLHVGCTTPLAELLASNPKQISRRLQVIRL